MVTSETFRGIFTGQNSIYVGWIKIEDGMIFIQERKFLFLKKWRRVGGNISNLKTLYQEKKVHDPDKGLTDEIARVYPLDIDTGMINYAEVNIESERENTSLKLENDRLRALLFDATELLKATNNYDSFIGMIKRNFDNYMHFNKTIAISAPNKAMAKGKGK